jgi:S-adenosylmethionine-diacylglycerol 3-amino-3-carboxypropyl transferase
MDYLLAGCGDVHAVDINPIQNALLELKKVMALTFDYQDFNAFFGRGRHLQAHRLYQQFIRWQLSPPSRAFWDKNITFFSGHGWRSSFYYRGCAGLLAKFLTTHLFHVKSLKKPLEDLMNAPSLEGQRDVYLAEIQPRLWTRWMRWVLNRSVTTDLMGVPRNQREHMRTGYPGGISKYIEDSLEAVLTKLRFKDNYFYRVYMSGEYPDECRPEYLKESNYDTLRERLANLSIHTAPLTSFLEEHTGPFSRFVLLDHMDWMSAHRPRELVQEWNAILRRATPGARAIFRSASRKVDYLDNLEVSHHGEPYKLGDLLHYQTMLAETLHPHDRVHTYASFSIVNLPR